MRRWLTRRVALLAVSLLAACAVAQPASAKTIFSYDVDLYAASLTGTASSKIEVSRLDTVQSTTVRVTHLGGQVDRKNIPPGSDRYSFTSVALSANDVVEVYQPGIPAGDPPLLAPNETFTIPDASIDAAVGATTMTGRSPDGVAAVAVAVGRGCHATLGDDLRVTPSGGSFAIPLSEQLRAGTRMTLIVLPGGGDRVTARSRAAGETPCVVVNSEDRMLPPGTPANPTPYRISLNFLRPSIATVRIVLKRGGVIYSDTTPPLSGENAQSELSSAPLPGDSIELYRPAAAATPSATYTVPQLAGTFDPTNDKVAVDSEALALLAGYAANSFINFLGQTWVGPVPAGRNWIDFSQPSLGRPGSGISDDASVIVTGVNASDTLMYTRSAVRGDLVKPVIGLSLKRPFAVSSVAKSFKFALTSTEAATARVQIRLPRSLPSAKWPSRKPGRRTRIVAKRTLNLKAGRNTLKLVPTRTARRAIAGMRAAGRRMRTVPVTVSVTATDAAGNSTTVVKRGRIVR